MPATAIGTTGIATPVLDRANIPAKSAPGFNGQFEQAMQKQGEAVKEKVVEEAKNVVDQDKLDEINEAMVSLVDKQISNPLADTSSDTLAMLNKVKALSL